MASLENKFVPSVQAHYSRIIASFRNVGGSFEPTFEKVEGKDHTYKIRSSPFEDWLKTLPLTEEEIKEIKEMEECGKFELENSASKFIKAMKPVPDKEVDEDNEAEIE